MEMRSTISGFDLADILARPTRRVFIYNAVLHYFMYYKYMKQYLQDQYILERLCFK